MKYELPNSFAQAYCRFFVSMTSSALRNKCKHTKMVINTIAEKQITALLLVQIDLYLCGMKMPMVLKILSKTILYELIVGTALRRKELNLHAKLLYVLKGNLIGPYSGQSKRGEVIKTEISTTARVANKNEVLDPGPIPGLVHTIKDMMFPGRQKKY